MGEIARLQVLTKERVTETKANLAVAWASTRGIGRHGFRRALGRATFSLEEVLEEATPWMSSNSDSASSDDHSQWNWERCNVSRDAHTPTHFDFLKQIWPIEKYN